MNILQQIPDMMQTILQDVPDEAAANTGSVKRKRKLTGSTLTKTLVFGWMENPEASYQQLADTATSIGTPVSPQALEQRMTPDTAKMLKQILDAAITEVLKIATQPHVLPLLQEFNGIFVQDSTWLSLPDELHDIWEGQPKKNHPKKSSMKLHLRFDVLTGSLHHFQLTDGITADSTAMKASDPLPQGSLHLADLAYFSLDELEKLTADGIYWITRLKANSYVCDEVGEPFCLEKTLTAEENTFFCKSIRIGKKKQLPVYLIAQRLSDTEANRRRRHIRYRASRKCETPSKARLRLAGYNLYITNIQPDQLTPKQICAIVRIRWQIELMYKGFKSIGKLDRSRSQKPYRILSEIYAKLIGVLIQHSIMLVAGWQCIQHSIIKTINFICGYVRLLLVSFHQSKTALIRTLKSIKYSFENGGNLLKCCGKNTTLRRLQEVTENP